MAKTGIRTNFGKPVSGWRRRLYIIIFEADTPAGWWFDFLLIVAILASVLVVVLDSVAAIAASYGKTLDALEWFFTFLFTIEYVARLSCVRHPLRYARSFFGIIDLLSILPSYISLFFPDLQFLADVRILRLLRMFRLLKLASYVYEYSLLAQALTASRRKIFIFISVVFIIVFLLGTVMYVVEGPENGFTSIPTAVYWAITAITTVGFGDIVPQTDLGRAIASVMMLLGWGILAVPTGIITSEMTAQRYDRQSGRRCDVCGTSGHDTNAGFCRQCGSTLPSDT
jgi:voltage-gated potassium channel